MFKLGRTRQSMEPRGGPQAGRAGYPHIQNTHSLQPKPAYAHHNAGGMEVLEIKSPELKGLHTCGQLTGQFPALASFPRDKGNHNYACYLLEYGWAYRHGEQQLVDRHRS